MPEEFWNFLILQNRKILFGFFLVNPLAWAVNGWIPVDDTEIKFPDGIEIVTQRSGPNSHRVILKKNKKILWERNFEQEYDRLWDYAFFVPIKRARYSSDLNQDGFPEIAIGTWDGGNNMANRTVLIFTVKKESLAYYGTEKFNLEYGKYVFP